MTKNNNRFPDNSILGLRILYVAILNPTGVNKLAYSNGYQPPKDTVDSRVGFLNKFISDEGEDALTQLLSIHPDKDLILDNVIDEVKSNKDNYSSWIDNVVEVSGRDQKYSNMVDPEPVKEPAPIIITPTNKPVVKKINTVTKEFPPYITITLIVAFTLVAIALIMKNKI